MKLSKFEVIRLGGRDRQYSVEKQLGQGTLSTVYLLKDWEQHRNVVVKFLGDNSVHMPPGNSHSVFGLLDAARALARLPPHPNLVATHDTGVYLRVHPAERHVRTTPYILTEWAENGAFSEDKCKTLSDWLFAFRDAATVLSFLHNKFGPHGNIKASNILLCSGGKVKLADFGLRGVIEQLTMHAGRGARDNNESPSEDCVPEARSGDVAQLAQVFQAVAERSAWDLPPSVRSLLTDMAAPIPADRPQLSDVVARLDERAPEMRTPGGAEECLQGIRSAVVATIETCITAQIARQAVVTPGATESPTWYATVLLRPTRPGDPKPLDCFMPIYFAQYQRGTRAACSDWRNTPGLKARPLGIKCCCSGLPILIAGEGKGLIRETPDWHQYFELPPGNQDRLKYLIIKNLRKALDKDTFLGRIYAGDVDVGWDLRDDHGNSVKMTREIETEIVVPIYSPDIHFNPGARGTADWILGVINVEYTQSFSSERRRKIAEALAKCARTFPFSGHTRDVLFHVTRQYAEHAFDNFN